MCAILSTVLDQVSTSILPYLKLWPVDTYVNLMMQVTYGYPYSKAMLCICWSVSYAQVFQSV